METGRKSTDSMKSTWRKDKSQWGPWHYLYDIFAIHPNYQNVDTPIHAKSDPVPHLSDFSMTKWIVFHASIPLALHQAYVYLTGKNLSPTAAFIFYAIAFKAIAIHELICMRYLGHVYGFFDGDEHARDEVPDWSVGKVVRSLISTSTFRPLMAIILSYNRNLAPAAIDWRWLPLEIGLYGIILDFWFYWYHRLMHDTDVLWKYHRTHHLTKHPNPLLTLYADSEQEFFDIAGVPFMTWGTMKLMGMPMGFYEWWYCYMFVVFSELFGHSGLRLHGVPPSTLNWLLKWTGTELVIEDHDLHHRKGYKKSANYGKQTRLWDVVFGTARDRVECTPQNIDYSQNVSMPIFSKPVLPPKSKVPNTS